MVVKLSYYQTDAKVVITLFDKEISAPVVDCQEKHLKVTVNDRVLLDSSLYDEVVPEEYTVKFTEKKVELVLKKKNPSTSHWPKLEDEKMDKKTKKVYGDKWSQLIDEVEEEEENNKDGLQAVFQKVYKTADDDTRKAMIKSWTESNGTVFSTNWNEVGSKKVEPKGEDTLSVTM